MAPSTTARDPAHSTQPATACVGVAGTPVVAEHRTRLTRAPADQQRPGTDGEQASFGPRRNTVSAPAASRGRSQHWLQRPDDPSAALKVAVLACSPAGEAVSGTRDSSFASITATVGAVARAAIVIVRVS